MVAISLRLLSVALLVSHSCSEFCSVDQFNILTQAYSAAIVIYQAEKPNIASGDMLFTFLTSNFTADQFQLPCIGCFSNFSDGMFDLISTEPCLSFPLSENCESELNIQAAELAECAVSASRSLYLHLSLAVLILYALVF
jgi:hypothetical protein